MGCCQSTELAAPAAVAAIKAPEQTPEAYAEATRTILELPAQVHSGLTKTGTITDAGTKEGSKEQTAKGATATGIDINTNGAATAATAAAGNNTKGSNTLPTSPPKAGYLLSTNRGNGNSTDDDSSKGSKGESSVGNISRHSSADLSKLKKPSLAHSTSAIGLDSMIESRKDEGDLRSNVVHIEVPFGKPIEEVYDGIHTGPVLGSGISGLVRLVTHKATGVKYAVKCLDLGLVETDEGLQQLREEIFIMCQLDHPNIVRLEEVYESHSEIYLVQELCLGGELFDRLDEQPDYHYTEAQCAYLVKQMLCSVRYLHSKGIIHRDLKLENFLFSSTSQDSELKMIDFGLSKHFKFGEVQHEAVGTPYTVAPEVIRGSYDERCDIWAIGVIAFLLLSGDPPFGGCGGPEPLMTVRSNILRGHFQFEPEDVWAQVSSQAREFISSMLKVNPQVRPTAKEAQKHSWLRDWSNRGKTDDDNRLNPNVVKALVSFKEFSDMRKLLCEVLSFTLLPDQIKDLRKEFEKMDTDGSGEISLGALKQVLVTNAGAGSLGSLTEEEVEDIFNAMRVRKSEKRIHWHEFIAAGISQCQVDDRNLRLAFDRLDSDHKGYITFENVMDLMGNDASQSKDSMRQMWGDSMKAVNCHHARITYEDFLLLMKGQTKEGCEGYEPGLGFEPILPSVALHVLHEIKSDDNGSQVSEEELVDDVIILPSGDKVHMLPTGGNVLTENQIVAMESPKMKISPHPKSAPVTPMHDRPLISNMEDFDSPLSMDEEDENADVHINAKMNMGMLGAPLVPTVCVGPSKKRGSGGAATSSLTTPPQSPVGSPIRDSETITPPFLRPNIPSVPEGEDITIPLLPEPVSPINTSKFGSKRRSRSFDQHDHYSVEEEEVEEAQFGTDAGRAMMLGQKDNKIGDLIKDEKASALVVNRTLYRAHRQMRLAVLEASKRFEEEQTRRARDILKEQVKAEDETKDTQIGMIGAGLVMRNGLSKQVSSQQVLNFLRKKQESQAALIEKANTRGGRGRRNRKKTISDMSSMMSGFTDTTLNTSSVKSTIPEEPRSPMPLLTHETAETQKKIGQSESNLDNDAELDIDSIIQATVPGEFRKARDPFSEGGRYSHQYSNGNEPPLRTFGTLDGLFPQQDQQKNADLS